jgi:hypothetical protein
MPTICYQLNDAQVTVYFDYDKGYPATFDDPGCDENVEITDVIYQGISILATISVDDLEAIEDYIYAYEDDE